MKNIVNKIISASLCAAVIAGTAGTAYALNSNKNASYTETENNKSSESENSNTELSVTDSKNSSSDMSEISKDETVYVLASADGNVQKIIVSNWIKNSIGASSIYDKSELDDITNVKGNETYSINSENAKVWDAQGNDIYYQGTIEKELPVGISVSYQLDGKTISAAELAGKSGHVNIRFDYDNRQFETVDIDGSQEKIYVPFAMLTGMLLDNNIFTNVEVSNGKLINDGDRTAIIGFAFPGLQNNLNIDKEDFEIPDYIEISADVKNFEFGITITIAANELFNNFDADKLDSAENILDAFDELNSAMNKLMNGSSELYDGLSALLDKSGELVEGINKLADGAETLKTGAENLDNGAAELQSGIAELHFGLSELSSNNTALTSGAKQVFETLLATAASQISNSGLSIPELTIENYTDVLNNVIVSLDENSVYNKALQSVTDAVNANISTIEEKVSDAVRTQVESQVTSAVLQQVTEQVKTAVRGQIAEQVIPAVTNGQLTKDMYESTSVDDEIKSAVEAAINSQMESNDTNKLINDKISQQMESDEIKAVITSKIEEQMQSQAVKDKISENTELQRQQAIYENMASDSVQQQLKSASEGAQSIISLKTSLDSYNNFYLGLLAYTDGVYSAENGAAQLNDGANTLKNGTSALCNGVNELYSGILQLKDGTPALLSGITQLKDGAMQLSDGLSQFNEQGIKKISDAVDGNISGLICRLKATVDVSKNYKTFSGLDDSMDGQVKFIYRTDSIKADN